MTAVGVPKAKRGDTDAAEHAEWLYEQRWME
jgi:hypothetical protein